MDQSCRSHHQKVAYSKDEYRLIQERCHELNLSMSNYVRSSAFSKSAREILDEKGSSYRTHFVSVRFTEDEFQALKILSRKHGVSFNRFVHDVSLLSIKKVERDGDIILISTDDAKDLRKQISFSSRNINQCARALNIIKKYPESSDYLELIEKAALETEEVKQLLERISGNLSCLIDQKKHFTLTGRGHS